ncbi:hypothetical protein [Marinovum sp.]|uniref:hypothetical protein n=1 Tax=Marinovum sp. TaxID=2024839 RepID=UPI002B27B9CE|nr:hypothetical protein [Marinovum sp.]
MLRLAVMFMFCAATMASAGAWPRDKGAGFLASSTQISGFGQGCRIEALSIFNNLYLEYGLTRSLTLGLDIGQSVGDDPNYRLFLRAPVIHRQGKYLSLEASLGQVGDLSYTALGLSFGRGFTLGAASGWFGLDTRRVQAEGPGAEYLRQSKVDVTAGLTFPGGVKAMAQVFHTRVGETLYTSLAPSVVVPLGKRSHLQGGLLFDLQSPALPGVKLGLWQEF